MKEIIKNAPAIALSIIGFLLCVGTGFFIANWLVIRKAKRKMKRQSKRVFKIPASMDYVLDIGVYHNLELEEGQEN